MPGVAMLEMEEQRIDYLSQLRPDEGYELNFAVATTYSLDLGALLGAGLALTNQSFDGDPSQANQVRVFASLAKLRERLAVFCEKGRIKNDDRTNQLCVLLEGLVHQVVVRKPMNAGTSLSSFHPKVWILDYVNRADKSHTYRLLVLSRNLTFDGSWDVAASLDGRDAGEYVPESEGIISFLEYLRQDARTECDTRLKRRIGKLQKTLRTVRFDVDSKYFDGYEFIPFGPKHTKLANAIEQALFTESYDNALIISPFLGNDGPLDRFATHRTARGQGEGRYILISREESLRRSLNSQTAAAFDLYTPQPWLSDIDIEQTDGGTETDEPIAAAYSDLHAKMYMTEGRDGRNLYLGSMNASRNAMYGNVEVLLRLHFKKRKGLLNEFTDSLIGEKCPFGKYAANEDTVADVIGEAEELLDRCFHSAAKLFDFLQVTVEQTGDRYCMRVEYALDLFKEAGENLVFSLAPYLGRKNALVVEGDELSFENLGAAQISDYFILSCLGPDGFTRSGLLCCPGGVFDDAVLNSDSRTKTLLNSILQGNDGALSDYIMLAFGLDPETYGTSTQASGGSRHLTATE